MSRYVIKSKEDFEAMMRQIDGLLQARAIPIQQRQLKALGEAAKLLEMDLKGGPLTTGPIPGVYEGDSLSAHIFEWIRHRYGDRLKVDFANGYSVIVLRGDAWLFKFPLVYGEFEASWDRDLSKRPPEFVMWKRGETPKKLFVNVLLCIEKLPQGLANELTQNELVEIVKFFAIGHDFVNTLNSYCRNDELAMTALLDLNTSARHCVAGSKEYGLSRWASLQAAEKLLKHYLTKRQADFPYTHKLDKLTAQAYQLGLPKIDDKAIQSVQCDPSVRYQQGGQSLGDVVKAHHGAMWVGFVVMKTLYPG